MKKRLNTIIQCDSEREVSGIYTNSQKVKKDGMFAALRGTSVNGEDFIQDALDHGAGCILKYGEKDCVYEQEGCTFIESVEPRKKLAEICSKFYPSKFENLVAITGTNGKTSTVDFVRQFWELSAKRCASLGTLGIITSCKRNTEFKPTMTCPAPITLNKALSSLSMHRVHNVALEASSHGIDQYRMYGHTFSVIGFTNFSQDHLDYHQSMEEYWSTKTRLFTEYASESTVCVINADSDRYNDLQALCKGRVISYGLNAGDITFTKIMARRGGYEAILSYFGHEYSVTINIASRFQLYNILCAIGMASASGITIEEIVFNISKIRDVKGRMQFVGECNGGSIYVDYAHTPDGLRTALRDVRLRTKGIVHVLFGCGGDRDKLKRPEMGRIASEEADVVIVTDDNPRTEPPAQIRKEIIAECKHAIEIADRKQAIIRAVDMLSEDDCLLIAGKGHENYQIINDTTVHFDDVEEVRDAITIFTPDELNKIFNSNVNTPVTRISIDSRDVKPGDMFIAIRGESFDGNDFVDDAIANGASVVICSRNDISSQNVIVVNDTIQALHDIGCYARSRINAKVIGITGSVGKTSTKAMLATVFNQFSNTFSSIKNYNSKIGLPICLSMIRKNVEYAIIEMGMSNYGDILNLSTITTPNISIITSIAENHCEFFSSPEDIAIAKSEIFSNGINQDFAIIPGDSKYTSILMQQAHEHGIANAHTFGRSNSNAYIMDLDVSYGQSNVTASILGSQLKYSLKSTNFGIVLDSLIPILCAKLMGYNVEYAADALSFFSPLQGRGNTINLSNGSVLIDDTYNASPASMRAAIRSINEYQNMTKIAILGDMGELGLRSALWHAQLADDLKFTDTVLLCGDNMKHLHAQNPNKFIWFSNIDELKGSIVIPDNSVILVKGSRFMKMESVVNFILERYKNVI